MRVVRPLATEETPGAFLGGLRVMAIDGTVLDVPDSKANVRVWGYPGSRRGNTSRLRLESGQERLLSEIALYANAAKRILLDFASD